MLNEGVSTQQHIFADSLINEGKNNPRHHSIFTKEHYNTLLKYLRPNFGNTDLTNKILDQVVIREIIKTNATEVCIKVNGQPTKEAETIKEHHEEKKINSKIIDNVVKFKSTGHVRTPNLSDEGVSTVNQTFGKKILRNEKEHTPNSIDNETIKQCNPKICTDVYHNIDKKIDNRQNKVIDDTSNFTTAEHVSIITLPNDGTSKENKLFDNKIMGNANANTSNVIAIETFYNE